MAICLYVCLHGHMYISLGYIWVLWMSQKEHEGSEMGPLARFKLGMLQFMLNLLVTKAPHGLQLNWPTHLLKTTNAFSTSLKLVRLN